MENFTLIGKQHSNISIKHFDQIKNKICIVRNCGGLGDIINMRMIFSDIKNKYPKFKITWAVPNNYFPAAEQHPYVDEVISNSEVDQRNYLQTYNLTNVCTRYEWARNKTNDKNRADIWANHIGIDLENYQTYMPFYPKEKEQVKTKLKQIGWDGAKKVLILAPKSAIAVKNLTYEQVAIIKGFASNFFITVLHHHPILEFLNLKLPMLCGLNLKEALAAVELSDVVVSTDTGLMHVSGAYGKPTLAIFSYTSGSNIAKHYDKVCVVQGKYIHQGEFCGPCNNFTNCTVDNHSQTKPCLTSVDQKMLEIAWQKTLEKYINHINKVVL